MQTILTVLQVFLSLGLIGLVLIQHGRGADAGAAFGAGASGTVFGARGAGSFLSRATAVIATLFFLTSMALAYYAAQGGKPAGLMDGANGVQVVKTPAPDRAPVAAGVPVPAPSEVPVVPGGPVPVTTSDVPALPVVPAAAPAPAAGAAAVPVPAPSPAAPEKAPEKSIEKPPVENPVEKPAEQPEPAAAAPGEVPVPQPAPQPAAN